MNRIIDWDIALNRYLKQAQRKEFKWGEHDCCTFVAGAVVVMTGDDPMVDFRYLYNSKDTADLVIKEKCLNGSLFKQLYKTFGKPVPGCRGRKGDVAWMDGNCGIVLGTHALFFGPVGFVRVRISKLDKVFKIG